MMLNVYKYSQSYIYIIIHTEAHKCMVYIYTVKCYSTEEIANDTELG